MTDTSHWPRFAAYQPVVSKSVGFILNDHPFRCLDVPPAAVWRDIASPEWPQAQVIGFIESCLANSEDVVLFQAMIESRDIIIPIETLRDVVIMLIQEYGNRPTLPSNDSSNGVSPTPNGSTDGVSSPE